MSLERCAHDACEEFLNRAEYCPQVVTEDSDKVLVITDMIDAMMTDNDLISDESHFKHDGVVSTGSREFSFMHASGQAPLLHRTVKVSFTAQSTPKQCKYKLSDAWSVYGGEDGVVKAEMGYSIDVYPAGLVRAGLENICTLPGTEPYERSVTEFDCAAMLKSLKEVITHCTRPSASQDTNLT